ncbi:MAG: hypothetical protein PHR55_03050 [Bacilli bacterium]|nr:hypothetical protein [Bacilli bacterium]MDD4831612.1 hypothetical protein [Bacilli bacterium]
MERRKKRSRLFLLTISMLVTVMMLGTSTFAWFTANRTVTVDTIQVNIAASGGIQISEDGSSWRSLVTQAQLLAADVTYAAAVNQIPGTMTAHSTGLAVDGSGLMEMYAGSVTADGANFELSTSKSTETHAGSGGFVAFDLFIRLDAAATGTIYLTPNAGVDFDTIDTGIKNAARIAFVNLGETVIGSNLTTIQALNLGSSAVVRMWEPNYDSHTAAAITHALDTYGLTVADNDSTLVAYDGVIDEMDVIDNIYVEDANYATYPLLFDNATTPAIYTDEGFLTYPTAFTLNPGYITKMRIYMWVEGQDVDCENSASGANITFDLQFSLDNS